MDPKQLVMLALQVSIIAIVFSFGLRSTTGDLLYLLRRPSLLGRSLLAMFVIMPMVAVALARAFDFTPTVEIVLVALSIAPMPPLMPKRLDKAGGRHSFAIALMATVALLSVAIVPAAVALLGIYFGQPFAIDGIELAAVIFKAALLPLAAGIAVSAFWPSVASRLAKPVALVGNVLLILAALASVGASLPALWREIGNGTLIAIACFILIGIAVGHLLGGPDPLDRLDLAVATACRHPAIALAIASSNFPEERFGATIVLYLLLGLILSLPYLMWQRRKAEAAAAGQHLSESA